MDGERCVRSSLCVCVGVGVMMLMRSRPPNVRSSSVTTDRNDYN